MRGQIPVQEPQEVRQAAPEQRQDLSKYREQKQDLNDPNQQAAAQPGYARTAEARAYPRREDGRT